jgi:Ca2+-binding RTX toxin-like protein
MVAKGATADALNQAFTLDEVVAVRSHFTGKGLHDAIEDEKSHVGDVNGDGHNDALPNQAPTAVVLSSMQSLAENTVIGAGIKVADIAVTDDGYGVNRLALTGADKASFAIRDGANGKELWYIGASPDFETKSAYDVTVTVDDMAVGATPDASADFHLAITDVNDAPAAAVLSNRQTLAENTVIGAGIKVADIAITDDGLGLNQLGLTGADKASFEIRDGAGGKELWYVGASPDYETKKAYDVTVTVDDTTVGMTPDASADFHLTITDVYEAPPVVVDDDKVMKGGRGNDNLHGGSGHDSIYGGRGHDMLQGSDGNDQLYGEDGNDRLYGGSGQDSLRGGDGDDRLDGGAGGDQMWGGRGNDIYVVDNAGDRVVESPNQGYDTVNASISYSLANTSVERLVLTGGDNLNGSGNSLNNALVGNAGNNVLKGGAGSDNLSGGSGNDTLYGGAGTDRLTGGAGRDVFVFEKGGGHDTVTDYRDGQDRIDVSRLSGVHTVADLTLWQVGHDVMIAHGTDVLVLDDVSISVLHQSDFIF